MRAVVQRVSRAAVRVDGEAVGAIGRGLTILLGVGPGDDEAAARVLADKIVGMRIFEDAAGKTNLSAVDVGAEVLVVSQFTLYADTSRGRRPGSPARRRRPSLNRSSSGSPRWWPSAGFGWRPDGSARTWRWSW